MSGCPPFVTSGEEPAPLERRSTDLSSPILAAIYCASMHRCAATERRRSITAIYIPAITSLNRVTSWATFGVTTTWNLT